MAGYRPPAGRDDALYDTIRQAARRLTIGVATLNRLIAVGPIPVRSINGRRKIAKSVVGEMVASAYGVWAVERRPHYSVEQLRKLSAIRVEQVAAQLALGRSAAFEAVRNRQIPGRKLPNTDRWIVPEDVVARMEAYDLAELAAAPSHPAHSPHSAAEASADEDQAASGDGRDAASATPNPLDRDAKNGRHRRQR